MPDQPKACRFGLIELSEITPLPLIDLLDAIVAEIDRRKYSVFPSSVVASRLKRSYSANYRSRK
jgi:hypothetical protein